jgi:hypothetical protein
VSKPHEMVDAYCAESTHDSVPLVWGSSYGRAGLAPVRAVLARGPALKLPMNEISGVQHECAGIAFMAHAVGVTESVSESPWESRARPWSGTWRRMVPRQ